MTTRKVQIAAARMTTPSMLIFNLATESPYHTIDSSGSNTSMNGGSRVRLIPSIAVTTCIALLGCSPPPPRDDGGTPSGGCPANHICRPACSADADCLANEACTQGVCAAKPPTSTSYAGCAIDADCSRGDYCKLGACGHDCLSDAQCANGTVCDVRGQCVVEAQAGQPPAAPPRSAGSPVLTPALLDFGRSATSLTVSLSNAGGDPFDFRALSSQPWLSVSPFEGSVSGQPVTLTVTLDRAKLSASSAAFVAINTTAGTVRLPLTLATTIDGEWTASFSVEQPIALGTHAVPIILQEQGTTVTGWVDGERSAVYPVNAAVTGALAGTANSPELDLTFELAAAAGTTANPVIPTPMTRLVELTLAPTGAATVVGTFKETIKGLVGAGAVVTGHVTLTRVGPVRQGTIAPPLSFTVPPVPDPFVDASGNPRAAYQLCNSCPGTACSTAPSNFSTNALAFLNYTPPAASAPAALAFFGELNSVVGYTGVDGCIRTGCTTPRFDPSYLRCAQYWELRSARATNSTVSQANFIDLAEVPADAALFDGNSAIAVAHDAWFSPTATLASDAQVLQNGITKLEAGLFSPTPGAIAIGDPGILTALAAFPATSLAHKVPFPSNVATGPRAAGEAIRRALNTGSTLMIASNDLALTQRKQGDDVQAKATLTRTLLATYYLAAGLGQLVAASPTTWAPEVSELSAHWNDLRRALDEVALGRNAFGYAPGYVPFYWKYVLGVSSSNYLQIRASASTAFTTWKGLYENANNASRQFESSQAALNTEFGQQMQNIDTQLKALCGTSSDDLSTCGSDLGTTNASEVAQLWMESQAASKRVGQVVQQAQNIVAEIKIEQDRAAAVAKVSENNAMLIRSNGQKVAAIDVELANINTMQQFAHDAVGFVEAGLSGNPVAIVESFVNTGVNLMANAARTNLDADKAALQIDQQAQLEFSHSTVELINSAAVIKSKHLQLLSLRIDQDIALLAVAQANGRVVAAIQKAQGLVAERKRQVSVGTTNAQHALSYRVFSNYTARQALVAGQDALRWAYLSARALDYQLNQSVDLSWSELWGARSPHDLELFLAKLDSKFNMSPTTQLRTEVISLRDRILLMNAPIKNLSTGQVVNAQARFRAFVASPANRDADGNFHIRFSTIDSANPIFSSAIASDRISSIRVNLIGDSLGAGVTSAEVALIHGGTSFLRALTRGTDGTAPLIPYDVSGKGNTSLKAVAQAAINAPPGSPALQENFEMKERAVLTTGWELIIDSSEPANRGLDLSGLDDIELTFTHDAYTIQ